MPLETSKQALVICWALQDAGEEGLSFHDLKTEAEKLSVEHFDSDIYFLAPRPALSLLRELANIDHIVMAGGLGVCHVSIKDEGLQGLQFLEKAAGYSRQEIAA